MTLPVRGAGEGRFDPAPPHVTSARPPVRPEPVSAPRFADALAALGRQIDAGERLTKRALAPGLGRLDASQLIALQAGIYRYSEAVDLAAKLVDRAATAVKTTLQSQ
jgi:hypothetical protein